ncbi:hypothetical protein PQU92_02735 [Asticcacaulis sp. BYS171W]|uniref:Transposase n=1 Tax=Asticcacaulis aquaticus TaxID=2984212 RepID=A0ABT5HQ33_9CAUL|nr:hypothetical protein [Asticcacaulis aquaticus]MDC7682174.1 hypothetical protein [Asticcacaulis aquaticus]
MFEITTDKTSMKLSHGVMVLLTVARHDRDYMYCERKTTAKGEVYYDIANYRYREDCSALPQLPRAPQILDVIDLYGTDYADIA